MDDAGCPEDRQAADNAEPGVPCLAGDFGAVLHGNRDGDVGAFAMGSAKRVDDLGHHGTRDGIDGRMARRNGQARLGDHADAVARMKLDAASGQRTAHGCAYRGAMGDVGIVARVLDDCRHGMVGAKMLAGEGKGRLFALGQADGDGVGERSGQECGECGLGCGGCACTGCPATAKLAVGFSGLRTGSATVG